MKLNQKGFSVVESLLILVVLGIICGAGWYVWQANSSSDKNLESAGNYETPTYSEKKKTPDSPAPSSQISGWIEYENAEKGLKFKYPKEFGVLDKETMHTSESYINDSRNLQGGLYISLYDKEGFTVVAHKYGATIKPSADEKTWLVIEENPAEADNYKVGDMYKATEISVKGGKAIDLTYGDENCTLARWIFVLKNGYVEVSIPKLCPVFAQNKIQDIPVSNEQAYKKLKTDILSTVEIY